MTNLNDNITFFLKEKIDKEPDITQNNIEIQKMLDKFEMSSQEDTFEKYNNDCINNDLTYFIDKFIYSNDETYYNEAYTVKDLLKICKYYSIEKDIKTAKCKKQDIVSTIIYFESLHENAEIVQKRHNMWAYIVELTNDPKMKKYIIWN